MKLTGPEITRLMRLHKTTIQRLADASKVSVKEVNAARTNGADGAAAELWHFRITGHWPRVLPGSKT